MQGGFRSSFRLELLAERIFDPTSSLACEAAAVIRHCAKLQRLHDASICTRLRRAVAALVNRWHRVRPGALVAWNGIARVCGSTLIAGNRRTKFTLESMTPTCVGLKQRSQRSIPGNPDEAPAWKALLLERMAAKAG